MSDTGLEPISSEEALELYLADKEREAAPATVRSHRSRLSFFCEWCDEAGVESLRELAARDLHRYRVWRRVDGELNVTTEKTNQDTLRVFIRWCESIDAVEPGLAEKIRSPSLSSEENARDAMLDRERAYDIRMHLAKYEYATLPHVVFELLATTGMRISAAHGLDVGDYHSDASPSHLELRHRPETGTPLKNGPDGERALALEEPTCKVLDDYVAKRRPDASDDHGREPLLATENGRLSKSTMRKYVYKWTRPCRISGECPHGRVVDECEAAQRPAKTTECPSVVSPHAIRRGYITYELVEGLPPHVVSDRCNVSEAVIEEHYDERSEVERMQQRKDVMDDVHSME